MIPILKLKGVGPALAKTLLSKGIKSVEDLATASVETLRDVRGMGPSRTAQFQAAAQALLAQGTATQGSNGTVSAVPKPKRVPRASAGRVKSRTSPVSKPSPKADAAVPVDDEAPVAAGVDKSIAVAEAARRAAEDKAAKAEAKAAKAAKKARALIAEFAEAKEKAKSKAKKEKGKAKKAIAKEKAKEKKILAAKSEDKEKSGDKKKKSKKKNK